MRRATSIERFWVEIDGKEELMQTCERDGAAERHLADQTAALKRGLCRVNGANAQ